MLVLSRAPLIQVSLPGVVLTRSTRMPDPWIVALSLGLFHLGQSLHLVPLYHVVPAIALKGVLLFWLLDGCWLLLVAGVDPLFAWYTLIPFVAGRPITLWTVCIIKFALWRGVTCTRLCISAVAPASSPIWSIDDPTLTHLHCTPFSLVIRSKQWARPEKLWPEPCMRDWTIQLGGRDARHLSETPLAKLEEEGTTCSPEAILNHL